jgi:hypothetical protein
MDIRIHRTLMTSSLDGKERGEIRVLVKRSQLVAKGDPRRTFAFAFAKGGAEFNRWLAGTRPWDIRGSLKPAISYRDRATAIEICWFLLLNLGLFRISDLKRIGIQPFQLDAGEGAIGHKDAAPAFEPLDLRL